MHHTLLRNRDALRKPASGAHPPRILVVEDDEAFAEVMRLELEVGGYQVELTSSVSEAQRKMRDDSDLDLVISDVRLPGKTGLQLLFLEGADARPTPVLMMSAFISPKLRQFVEGMGAAVLEKPFTFANLHLAVIRLLRKSARATTLLGGYRTPPISAHAAGMVVRPESRSAGASEAVSEREMHHAGRAPEPNLRRRRLLGGTSASGPQQEGAYHSPNQPASVGGRVSW
jgi:DNA-binding response OmpR family regulator